MMMKIKNIYFNIVGLQRLNLFRFYSVNSKLMTPSNGNVQVVNAKIMSTFYSWFVGFADAESSFSIVPKLDNKGTINRFTFMFIIGLHLDDFEALNCIQSNLGIGVVRIAKDECKYVVTKKEDVEKLISIFDTYNLNTSKYLDYLDFKKAFNLYFNREGDLTEELKKQVLELKDGMNIKRSNFNMPADHTIVITKSWLLGLIEGEGSFQLWRNDCVAVFSLVLTEIQLPVLIKIKEFLINDLGFDSYSKFKLNSTSAITINHQKARNNSKASVLILIKNIYILNNYLVPYLDEMQFITKKGLDFKEFKIICNILYIGAHKKEEIKLLIFKLSHTMNNYRLSTNSEPVELFNSSEVNTLVNAPPLVLHLEDGRQINLITGKIIHQHSSSVYEVIKSNNEVVLKLTLFEAAGTLGINIKTLSKLLDEASNNTVKVKDNLIKRVAVFYNKSKIKLS
jgi:LAGLIDADG endonuclease